MGIGSNKEALFDQRGKKMSRAEGSRPDMKKDLPALGLQDAQSKLVPVPDGNT